MSESLETVRQMVAEGIDAIEISANIGRAVMKAPKNGEPERPYFRDSTTAVKRTVDVPVILVGGVRSLEMAQSVVDSGDADLVSMCRPFIREPGIVNRWQNGDRHRPACISCNQCLEALREGRSLGCVQDAKRQETSE